LGNAPDSWGIWFPQDKRQVGWEVFLDEVRDAGYTCIELGPWGYLPTDSDVLKTELGKRNLKLVASTVGCDLNDDDSVEELIKALPEITALQKDLDAGFVVLLPPMITDLFTGEEVLPRTLTDDQRQHFNANIERLGRLMREEYGLVMAAHPHVDSHLETEGDIENLLASTDPSYVSLCLDIGHHAYGGGDACRFLRKCELKASGVARIINTPPEYIGWRTMA
jgi:inosose dehydratase